MDDTRQPGPTAETVEAILREELAHGDVILATADPILRHLLASVDQSLFSDEVIARIRGMMLHLARQMLFELAVQRGVKDPAGFVDSRQDAIALSLLDNSEFLAHAHSLTIETQFSERLSQRSGMDPVLSPLLQELVASQDTTLAQRAMHFLASQARFMQQQRRMEWPLDELPPALFETALDLFVARTSDLASDAECVRDALMESYAADHRRVSRAVELIEAMQQSASRALDVGHAGVALFVTALAMATDQHRDTIVLSLAENQCARLALSLRAAGLGQAAVEDQFLFLHPEIILPEGFDNLRSDRAAALLGDARSDFLAKGVN